LAARRRLFRVVYVLMVMKRRDIVLSASKENLSDRPRMYT
jgi:hypothetical protein